MTWFAWKGYDDGKAVDIAGSQEKQAVILGFHGYETEAQAEANPNTVAGFPNPLAIPQKSFVNLIIADYGYAKKAGEQPGGPHATPTPGNVAAGTVQAGLSSLLPVFQDTRQLVGRAVKVVLGMGLILAGLTMLVKQETNISPLDVAKVAAL